jgi:hypothetical protein
MEMFLQLMNDITDERKEYVKKKSLFRFIIV